MINVKSYIYYINYKLNKHNKLFTQKGLYQVRIYDRIKTISSKNKWIFISYLTVLSILIIVYALIGIYPFGEYAILKSDLFHSYAPQLNDVQNKINAGQSLTYSWNGALGGNMINSIITILSSPFNILLLLFPVKYTTELIALIILLKIPVGAVTFHIFSRDKFKTDGLIVLAFSVMYALSAYATAYHWNIMWLDTMVIFPLVIMGIDNILKKGKASLYCAALIYAIFTSYGTAIQVCFFSAVYFLCSWVARLPQMDKNEKLRAVLRFSGFSLLAGGVCAISLLPVLIGLPSTGYFQESFPRFEFYFNVLRFFAGLLWGAYPTNMVFSESVPNIYAGVLTVILIPFYFINKQISFREKIKYAILMIFIFLCFNTNVLTFILHGMHFPAMMPHRYSYIYSFFLLIMAFRAFKAVEKASTQKIYVSLIIFGAIMAVLTASFFLNQQNIEFPKPGRISLDGFIINAFLAAVYMALLYLIKKFRSKKLTVIMPGVLIGLILIETTSNAFNYFKNMGDGKRVHYALDLYDDMETVTQLLKEEPEFYRAEFKHERTLSDPKIYDYNGINQFAGLAFNTQTFMDRIGLSASHNYLLFTNPTPVLMSFFNQKYLFNKNARMQETFTVFDFKQNYGNIFLYENPYVLPLGFMVSEDLSGFDINRSNNPYELQNDLVNMSVQGTSPVFSSLPLDGYDLNHITLTGQDNDYSFEIDENVTPEMEPKIILHYTAAQSKYTYFNIRTNGATKAIVKVNGHAVLDQSYHRTATSLDAGYVNAGDTIDIEIMMNKRSEDEEKELIRFGNLTVYAAQMDFDVYKSAINKLSQNPLKVAYYDNTTVRGNVSANEEGLLFTSIPYDANWKISVDGKAIEPRIIGDALMAIKLYPGEHLIEMSYKINGAVVGVGLWVSIASAAVYVVVLIRERRKKGDVPA